MDIETGHFTPAHAAIHDLRGAMLGTILSAADAAYAGARRVWNGAVDRFPAEFEPCEIVDDVDPDDVFSAIPLPL